MLHALRHARSALVALVALLEAGSSVASAAAAGAADACLAPDGGLGVARIVEIDASSGPLIGALSHYQHTQSILAPKEVVLTFDDGPIPFITNSILDTLDRFCTKATFFSVGRMAQAYPATIKAELARGHTVGTHTLTHPLHINRMAAVSGEAEIDRGFEAVAKAAGGPIAPLFRFPGLNDSGVLLNHLQAHGIATVTVDVISDDSFIHDAKRLIQTVLARVEARQGGIILFHDIKVTTAQALPTILSELKRRGYQVVHMRAKDPWSAEATLRPSLAAQAQGGGSPLGIPAGSPVSATGIMAPTFRQSVQEPEEPQSRLAQVSRPELAASLTGPPVVKLELAAPVYPMDLGAPKPTSKVKLAHSGAETASGAVSVNSTWAAAIQRPRVPVMPRLRQPIHE